MTQYLTLKQHRRAYVAKVIAETGSVSAAAVALHTARSTLQRIMRAKRSRAERAAQPDPEPAIEPMFTAEELATIARRTPIPLRRRRMAAIWMLHISGVPHVEIAAEMDPGLSRWSIADAIRTYQNLLQRRHHAATTDPCPRMKRLRAAGAL